MLTDPRLGSSREGISRKPRYANTQTLGTHDTGGGKVYWSESTNTTTLWKQSTSEIL